MKLNEVKRLLKGKRLKKSMGQNLLINRQVGVTMVEALGEGGKEVLEIGPGLGAVTEIIIERGFRPVCVELDTDFCVYLKERFGKSIELYCTDFFLFPPDRFRGELATGSLPYRGAKKMLVHLLLEYQQVKRATFLLQKEVAEILSAPPGTRKYSPLSVILHLRGKSREIKRVSPVSFYPRPEVQSSVVLLEIPGSPPEKNFYKFLKECFRYRRKKLKNNLKGSVKGFPQWFPCERRAEEIEPEGLFQLYQGLLNEGLLPTSHET